MSDPDKPALPRREFGQRLMSGLGGAAFGMSIEPAVAQDQPAEPKPPTVAELVLAQIVTQCPSEHWDEETLGSLLGDIRADIARGKTLRSVPLTNADEPGPIFAAYRGPNERM